MKKIFVKAIIIILVGLYFINPTNMENFKNRVKELVNNPVNQITQGFRDLSGN